MPGGHAGLRARRSSSLHQSAHSLLHLNLLKRWPKGGPAHLSATFLNLLKRWPKRWAGPPFRDLFLGKRWPKGGPAHLLATFLNLLKWWPNKICPLFHIPSGAHHAPLRRRHAFWRLLPQLRAEVSLRPPVRRRHASGGPRDALAQGEARRVGTRVLVAAVPGERGRPRGLVHHACRRVEKGPARRRLRLPVAHGPVRPATPLVHNGYRPPGLRARGASESPRRSAAGERPRRRSGTCRKVAVSSHRLVIDQGPTCSCEPRYSLSRLSTHLLTTHYSLPRPDVQLWRESKLDSTHEPFWYTADGQQEVRLTNPFDLAVDHDEL